MSNGCPMDVHRTGRTILSGQRILMANLDMSASSLVRKCVGGVAVSTRYESHGCTDITREFPISRDFWELKRMRKQWIPGSPFPRPLRTLVRG